MKYQRYAQVKIGLGAQVGAGCILGHPPRGRRAGELLLSVGKRCIIRPYSILYAGSQVGDDFETGTHIIVRESNLLGNQVKVGSGSQLEIGNVIGNRVRIHGGCFLELATLEDDVFIGPCVVMTDDPHPPCPRYRQCKGGVRIKRGAKIGAGSILLPGVTVGEGALIGAGSLVTKDIPDQAVAAGHPARVINSTKALSCWPGFYSRPYAWETERPARKK